MPFTYTAEYSTNGYTWTALTNVQSISGFIGRQKLQDTFEPSRMTVSLRYPTGYASPITALVVGTYIRISRVGAILTMWQGKIRNVAATYGIPYSGGVGNADYVTIECEGALAEFGRVQGNGYVIAQDLVFNQLEDAFITANLPGGTTFTLANSPTLAASTVDNSYAQWLNVVANSTGATIKDGDSGVGVYTKDFIGTLSVGFSDAANDDENQVYDGITFDSISADFYTQVEVNTNSVGTVTAETGPEPYRTLRIDTFNVSTAQASDVANYWLGVYNPVNFGITEITCLAESQADMNLELGRAWYDIIGYNTTVTFRGTTYYMTILGASIDATPESARYTYYVADNELFPYEVLDDPIYGQFDNRKLSW